MPIPARLRDEDAVRALEEAFHETHERVFAVREPGQFLECLLWKVRATAVLEKPQVRAREVGAGARRGRRPRLRATSARPAGPRSRATRAPRSPEGAHIEGPAIIHEPTTTVVVYPDSSVTVTALGNYVLELEDVARRGKSPASRWGRHELLRPRAARGHREPARLDRARDGEHAPAQRPLRRAQHGARLLVRPDHRRQPAARLRRGAARARDRDGVPRQGGDRPARRPRGGRRLPAQRPLPRQHPSRRPRHPRAGLLGREARVHGGGEGASGRLRQRAADDVHALRPRRLRGGRADLPGRARAARQPGHRRHHPHVPPPHPRAGPVVRRLPGHGRRGANRRGAPEGSVRQVRPRSPRAVRRGVVRLLGAADRARDRADAEGHDRRSRLPRSVRPRARRYPHHGQGDRGSGRRGDRARPDGQRRLPAGGRERVARRAPRTIA